MELQDPQDRIEFALKAAWGKRIPNEIGDKYRNRQWGADVEAAIAMMRVFEPAARGRIKAIFTVNLERVQALLEDGVDDLETWKQKTEYFEALKKGTELIQAMLPLVEHASFGMVEEDEIVEEDGEVMDALQRELRTQ